MVRISRTINVLRRFRYDCLFVEAFLAPPLAGFDPDVVRMLEESGACATATPTAAASRCAGADDHLNRGPAVHYRRAGRRVELYRHERHFGDDQPRQSSGTARYRRNASDQSDADYKFYCQGDGTRRNRGLGRREHCRDPGSRSSSATATTTTG